MNLFQNIFPVHSLRHTRNIQENKKIPILCDFGHDRSLRALWYKVFLDTKFQKFLKTFWKIFHPAFKIKMNFIDISI